MWRSLYYFCDKEIVLSELGCNRKLCLLSRMTPFCFSWNGQSKIWIHIKNTMCEKHATHIFCGAFCFYQSERCYCTPNGKLDYYIDSQYFSVIVVLKIKTAGHLVLDPWSYLTAIEYTMDEAKIIRAIRKVFRMHMPIRYASAVPIEPRYFWSWCVLHVLWFYSQKWKSQIQISDLGREGPYFVKEHSDTKNKYTEDDIINMLEFLVDNIFVVFQWAQIVPLS